MIQRILTTAMLMCALAVSLGNRECNSKPVGVRGEEFPIDVVILNYPDFPPLPFTAAQYRTALFDNSGTYRMNPVGQPVYGSVREWFLNESNGRFMLTGDVREEPLVAAQTWASVQAQQIKFAAGEEGGEWWVANLVFDALTAMGEERHQDSIEAPGGLVVIHNAPTGGWAWGSAVVMSGHDSGFLPVGLATHELGHLLLDQPDRYWFAWGPTANWDNMAYDYDNFPTHWINSGHVMAGWATFDDLSAETEENLLLEPHAGVTTVRTFKSRANTVGGAAFSFFYLENRSPRDETEIDLVGPTQGVLMFEADQTTPWSRVVNYDTGQFESARLFNHRSLYGVFSFLQDQFEDDASWARSSGSYLCSDGTSLNILGECLWTFENIRRTDEKNFVVDAQWQVHEPELRGGRLSLGPSAVPRRLYFETSAGDITVRARTASGESTTVLQSTAFGRQLLQNIVDLDRFHEGVELVFSGSALSRVRQLRWVERTLAVPTQAAFENTRLRDGSIWGSKITTLEPGTSASIPASGLSHIVGAGIHMGYLRLVMSYGIRGRMPDTGSSDRPTERITMGPSFGYGGYTAEVPVNRLDPFVVLMPVALHGAQSYLNEYQIVVSRGDQATSDPLHVLAADWVTAPLPGFSSLARSEDAGRVRLRDSFAPDSRTPPGYETDPH